MKSILLTIVMACSSLNSMALEREQTRYRIGSHLVDLRQDPICTTISDCKMKLSWVIEAVRTRDTDMPCPILRQFYEIVNSTGYVYVEEDGRLTTRTSFLSASLNALNYLVMCER